MSNYDLEYFKQAKTAGEFYRPIHTVKTSEEAKVMLEAMTEATNERDKHLVRRNIAYVAGYANNEECARVLSLFGINRAEAFI